MSAKVIELIPRPPCRECDGERYVQKYVRGLAISQECPRCFGTGYEPGPSERDLERAFGQRTLFGGDAA